MTNLVERAHLTKLAAGKVVCELGVWTGTTTIDLARVAEVVHAVDWHRGMDDTGVLGTDDTLVEFANAVTRAGLREKVVMHVGHVEQVAPVLTDHIFDLLFIDASHHVDQVRRDLNLMRRTVRKDGLIAFHDYGYEEENLAGPKVVVDEVFGGPLELVSSLAVVKAWPT